MECLSSEKIAALCAGQALDCLIAEHVCGMTSCPSTADVGSKYYQLNDVIYAIPPDHYLPERDSFAPSRLQSLLSFVLSHTRSRCQNKGWQITDAGDGYSCWFGIGSQQRSLSLAHAVCLGCLEAVYRERRK